MPFGDSRTNSGDHPAMRRTKNQPFRQVHAALTRASTRERNPRVSLFIKIPRAKTIERVHGRRQLANALFGLIRRMPDSAASGDASGPRTAKQHVVAH